ncbi:MAG: ATP-binding protein, partial [Methanobacteriota archaeon]
DLKMIQRAITHLLDNALAFTPQGGKVTIALNMMKDGINVTISDTGEGISTKDLPYIFERSFRVDRSRSRGHRRGAGLGLAITRKILELHDSAISVRSTIHKGTTFSFQLPLYSP